MMEEAAEGVVEVEAVVVVVLDHPSHHRILIPQRSSSRT
jgi:hypothetical protein